MGSIALTTIQKHIQYTGLMLTKHHLTGNMFCFYLHYGSNSLVFSYHHNEVQKILLCSYEIRRFGWLLDEVKNYWIYTHIVLCDCVCVIIMSSIHYNYADCFGRLVYIRKRKYQRMRTVEGYGSVISSASSMHKPKPGKEKITHMYLLWY